jgi:hypothetical protein
VRHVRGKTFMHQGPLPPVPDAVHQLKIEKATGKVEGIEDSFMGRLVARPLAGAEDRL